MPGAGVIDDREMMTRPPGDRPIASHADKLWKSEVPGEREAARSCSSVRRDESLLMLTNLQDRSARVTQLCDRNGLVGQKDLASAPSRRIG